MRFMVMMYPGPDAEAGRLPTEQDLTAMGAYNEQLAKAGVILSGEGLQPTSKGVRVRFSGGAPTVSDGPFAEAKEIIGGFWLWQVKSKEEAVEWARRCPATPGQMLELRQVFEMADFGEAMTPELRAAEERLREETEARQMKA
jgi:hypothetical protein